MSGVIVLNASYEQLHVVSIPHAIRMLVREVAVVEEAHDGASIGPFPLPRVLRLVRRDTDTQLLLHGRHGEVHISQLELRRFARARAPLDQHHRYKHVGRVV